VVLLAAGLGTTKSALTSLRISRFDEKCNVELGPLSKESERAVIQDWLKKEGRAKGDPTAWIDSIANESHGWPHHILSYVDAAVEYLELNNGSMTEEGLKLILKGAEFRLHYYRQRAHGIITEKRQLLARSLVNVPIGGTTNYTAIMSILLQEYSQKDAEDLFNISLEKGIIDERNGDYGVPIPSMHTWLLNEYTIERIELPKLQDSQILGKESIQG